MSAKSEKLTVIQLKLMRIAYWKAFGTPKIGKIGMQTWIIEMTVKAIVWPTLQLI
jgi:hypothetical protein